MSSILPQGIVINTDEISDDIDPGEGQPLPVDQIARMWKVYTATHRRLLDPTAERLENYWWRIWGSRNMKLDGSVAARLFLDISFGPTIVPLRGPPNRDESGGQRNLTLPFGAGIKGVVSPLVSHESDSLRDSHSSVASQDQSVMPPPILKKTKGQPTAGPRPTARFVSPHGSENDATESPSAQDGNSHGIILVPTSEAKSGVAKGSATLPPDGAVGARRKGNAYFATTTGLKRRPGVARRTTLQSSIDSGLNDPQSTLETATVRNETSRRSKQEFSDDSISPTKGQARPKLQGFLAPGTESKAEKAEKGAAKKPRSTKSKLLDASIEQNSTSKSTSELETVKKVHGKGKQRGTTVEAGPSSGVRVEASTPSRKVTKDDLDEQVLKELELQEALLAQGNERLVASKHAEQIIDGKSVDLELPVSGLAPRESLSTGSKDMVPNLRQQGIRDKNNSLLPSSNNSAERELDSEGWEDEPSTTKKGKEKSAENNLFAKRPVQPVSTTASLLTHPQNLSSGNIGRSKSHLTLLLEEDRLNESRDKKSGSLQTPSN